MHFYFIIIFYLFKHLNAFYLIFVLFSILMTLKLSDTWVERN